MRIKIPYFYNADPADPDLGGGPIITDPPQDPPASYWPDDWASHYAGEDEKKLNLLGRYASPEAVFDANFAAQAKLRSGELRSTAPFPDTGTDEDKNLWRETNGVPLTAEGYEFKEVPEEDKEFSDSLRVFAHEKNIPSAYAGEFINFLLEQDGKQDLTDNERDAQLSQEAEDKLRLEWGPDYRRNLNVVDGFLDTAPEGVRESIMNARMEDGTPLKSNVDMMRFLVDSALQLNPMATLVPSGVHIQSNVNDRLNQINEWMQSGDDKYWKDEKVQEEWRKLSDYQKTL